LQANGIHGGGGMASKAAASMSARICEKWRSIWRQLAKSNGRYRNGVIIA